MDPDSAPRLALTVTTHDRFSVREDLHPSNAVHVPASSQDEDVEHVQVQLYACTHNDGTGYHYECIVAAAMEL